MNAAKTIIPEQCRTAGIESLPPADSTSRTNREWEQEEQKGRPSQDTHHGISNTYRHTQQPAGEPELRAHPSSALSLLCGDVVGPGHSILDQGHRLLIVLLSAWPPGPHPTWCIFRHGRQDLDHQPAISEFSRMSTPWKMASRC
jgi:hypothetical protein